MRSLKNRGPFECLSSSRIAQFIPNGSFFFFSTVQCHFNKNSDKDIQQLQDAQGGLLSSAPVPSNPVSLKGSCIGLRKKKSKHQILRCLIGVCVLTPHIQQTTRQFALTAEWQSPQIQGRIQVKWCLKSDITQCGGSAVATVTIINMWFRLGNGCGHANKNDRKSNR